MDFHGPRTQIFKEENATNETVIIYTVPDGKEFHFIEATLKTDAGAAGTAELGVRDGDDVLVRHVCFVDVRSNNQGIVGGDTFEPAFAPVIPAGYDIFVTSDTGSLEAEGDIFGFEVPAQP